MNTQVMTPLNSLKEVKSVIRWIRTMHQWMGLRLWTKLICVAVVLGGSGVWPKESRASGLAVRSDHPRLLLTSTIRAQHQWTAVRKLVGDVSGSKIYWYVESWDGLNRNSKTGAMIFILTN